MDSSVVAWFVALPLQVAMVDAGGPGPPLWAGVVLWCVGFFFEAVGDWQLRVFAADPASKGLVMDRGLCRYTLHPNYFGDAWVWWGFFLIAADAGGRPWLTVARDLWEGLVLHMRPDGVRPA